MPNHCNALLKDADQAFNAGQYAKAGEIYQQAAAAAEQASDGTCQTEALSMAARSYLIQSDGKSGHPWLARAAAIADAAQPMGWSRYLGVRGRFEWKNQEDNAKATATFEQMYDYCMQHKLYSRAVDAAHMVAITGSDHQQVEWAHKGIKAAEQSGETNWLGPLWNNLGWTYDQRKEYDKALDALLKAQEYHHKTSGDVAKLAADIFVGRAYRMVGDIKESQRRIDQAYQRAKELIARKPDDENVKERLGNTHEQLGELAALRGDNTEAIQHFGTSKQLLVDAGAEKWGPKELQRLDDRIKEIQMDLVAPE